MTDTEKAALERRIDELCAEVERLKSEFKKMDVWHSQELKAAMDENAKLRYVAENLAMIANDLVCDNFDRDEMLEKANEDLRSLGVEVPS